MKDALDRLEYDGNAVAERHNQIARRGSTSGPMATRKEETAQRSQGEAHVSAQPADSDRLSENPCY
jgi:hypothetical protein